MVEANGLGSVALTIHCAPGGHAQSAAALIWQVTIVLLCFACRPNPHLSMARRAFAIQLFLFCLSTCRKRGLAVRSAGNDTIGRFLPAGIDPRLTFHSVQGTG